MHLVPDLAYRGPLGRGPSVRQLEAIHEQLRYSHQFNGGARQCRRDDVVNKERTVIGYKDAPSNRMAKMLLLK